MSSRIDTAGRRVAKAPDEEVLSLLRRLSEAAREDPEVRQELADLIHYAIRGDERGR